MAVFTRWERKTIRPMISDLTKVQLIDALRRVQHFCPASPSRQEKAELVRRVCAGLLSERYGDEMRAAVREARKL